MKDFRSKKTIAAGLSLTLALGCVPAVALADDAVDQDSEGAVSAQSARVSLVFMANGGQFADGNDFVLASRR